MKTINGWTKEKMLAQVKLKMEGKPFAIAGLQCSYRTHEGACCAVGAFMSDEVIERMLGKNLPVDQLPQFALKGMPLSVDDLKIMQDAHDKAASFIIDKRTAYGVVSEWIEENVD